MTVDGSDAIRRLQASVSPAMKSMTRDVKSFERALDGLDRNRSFSNLARQTVTASKVQATAIDSVTRALNKQTAAWSANTAARAANAAAPTGGPPARGGGSGGGGFSGGGGGRGGRGGAAGFLTGPVGLNGIALGASALPAATLAVTNLVGAVQQLSQAGLALPGVFAGIASSVGVAAIGFSGMSDAVKALNSGDLEKTTAALKDMDPAAQDVAKSVSRLSQGPLKDLRKSVQGRMFAGISGEIDTLSGKLMPTLTAGFGGIADSWNATFKELGRVGGSSSTGSILDRIFGNTAEGQKRANAAIEPLVKGVGTLTAAGTDILPRLGDAFASVATRFSNFITTADNNGSLAKWIDEGLTGVTNLGNTFLNLGKSIASITQAAGGDGGLLKLMEGGTKRLADFLGSAEGQQKLTAFFNDARERLREWLPVLGNVASVIGDVFRGFQQWGDVILPVVSKVSGALADMPGLLTAVVTAFLAFKTFSGFAGLLTGLGSISSLLGGIDSKLGAKGGGGILGKLGLLGVAIALPGVIDTIKDVQSGRPQKPDAGRSASLIGGGALAGARFGLPGAVIGAGVGLGTALAPVFANGSWVDYDRAQKQGTLPTRTSLGPGFRPGDRGGLTPRDPGYAAQQQNLAEVIAATDASQRARAALDGVGDAANGATTRVGGLGTALGKLTSPPPIKIQADTAPAEQQIRGFIGRTIGMNIRIPVTASLPGTPRVTPPSGTWFNPGRADGGLIPGYSPGVDNMLWPLSGGEGILIPEAARALGSRGLFAINSMFRKGLSRKGYADGGVVGAEGGGLFGDLFGLGAALRPVVDLLTQIRDTLGGKPISETALGTEHLGTGVLPGPDPLGALSTPIPSGSRLDAMYQLARQADGGTYKWGASDLASGLADCSGAVSDLVEIMTGGQATPGRLFSTETAAGVLQSLGFQQGLQPGALNIGFNKGHMAATLPNGQAFEAGGSVGGIALGKGLGAANPNFTDHWSLPAGGVGGLTDALGGMAGDMCGCIGDNMGSGLGQLGKDLITGAGGVAGEVGADIAKGFGGSYKPSGPNADPLKLIKEGNPAALATVLGYNVPDLSRTGGGPGAQNLMTNGGPGFNAQGQMMTDTALLIDRALSSFAIVMETRFRQMQDVLNQIRDQLAQIASKLVTAAASGGASVAGAAVAPGAADGRVFPGYAPGVDSILARVSPGEGVLIPEAVRGLGGAPGVYALNSRFRRGLSRANYPGVSTLPRFANGGVVSDRVGADFFGLSEIPVIGGIVNMLVSILLKILGIEIQARDTLQNMSAQVREFRGDFKSFDAAGRLASDSSGLIDRNESSKDVVNKERIRILTQVIIGVIKFAIEKIIMPLINAGIQAAINFGQQAISGAVGAAASTFAPGSGGVASGLANAAVGALGSVAQAGGQIFTEILGSVLTNGLTVLIEGIASILPTAFGSLFDIPGLFSGLFGGVAGLIGGIAGGIGGMAGGFFDDGGLALGTGYMAKNTIKPERVLNPRHTNILDNLLSSPTVNGSDGGRKVEVHVQQVFSGPVGSPQMAADMWSKLDALV